MFKCTGNYKLPLNKKFNFQQDHLSVYDGLALLFDCLGFEFVQGEEHVRLRYQRRVWTQACCRRLIFSCPKQSLDLPLIAIFFLVRRYTWSEIIEYSCQKVRASYE